MMSLPNFGEVGRSGKIIGMSTYHNGIKNRKAANFTQPSMTSYSGQEKDASILKSTIRQGSRNG
jgi:hypothetical protein